MTQGVVVGCDRKQEWLLSWWWEHYSKHNSFPVAFVDFGMSEKALAWCRERGICISLPEDHFTQEISPAEKKCWEERFGTGIWFFRSAWLKKPLALLHSPFSIGVWVDLDCQIHGMLDPLFNSLAFGSEIALVKEPKWIQLRDQEKGFLLPGEVNYNSGVIAFCQNASILHHWVEESFTNNHPGDQQALCRAIFTHRPSLIELPPIFNWLRISGYNPNALINHFTAGEGKLAILEGIANSLRGPNGMILTHE